MTDLQWSARAIRAALLERGRGDLAVEWEVLEEVLGTAWRTGYSDGWSDLHAAPVHGYSHKPRWYGWPAGWRRYLDGWHCGQRDLRFLQAMWATDELEDLAA